MMTYEERVATEIGRKAVTASKEDGAARLLDEAKAVVMSLLKISRLTTKGKRDSWVDLAGYAALGAALDEDGKI